MITVAPIAPGMGTGGGGSALIPLLVVAPFVFFGLQFRPKRRAVWAYRLFLIMPVLITVKADIRATWVYLTSFQLRQLVSPAWWRNRLRFRKIWEGWEKD